MEELNTSVSIEAPFTPRVSDDVVALLLLYEILRHLVLGEHCTCEPIPKQRFGRKIVMMMINSYFRKVEERKLPFPSSFPGRGDWREDNKLLVFYFASSYTICGKRKVVAQQKRKQEIYFFAFCHTNEQYII